MSEYIHITRQEYFESLNENFEGKEGWLRLNDAQSHILKQDERIKELGFSKSELDTIQEALHHLHAAKVGYLEWKKDEYSQKILPLQIEETLQAIYKIYELQKSLSLTSNTQQSNG